MSRSTRHWLVFLTFLAFALRLPALFANTFFPDEALYASWARLIATGRDVLLWEQAIDKPPFLFYCQALFLGLLGSSTDWAVWLPNLGASVLVVPLVGQLIWRIYRRETAVLAGVGVMALSPFAIQFSATAFTDPLLVTLLVGALVCGVGKRKTGGGKMTFYAGIFFALATATKQPAWLFLPLLISIGFLNNWQTRDWVRFFAGTIAILIPLFIWDYGRGVPDTWTMLNANFGKIRLAYSWELWERLWAWGKLWQIVFGSWWVVVFMGIGWAASRCFYGGGKWLKPLLQTYDWLWLGFLFGYFVFHWFGVIPVWDRYVMPAIPIVAILLGRVVGTQRYTEKAQRFTENRKNPLRESLFASVNLRVPLLLLLMLPFAWQARNGAFPVGGQAHADRGIAEIAPFLEPYPYGTVLYDQTSSWHWRHYLIDTKVFHVWYPNPDFLVHDLQVFADNPDTRLLILPQDDSATPTYRTLTSAGFALQYVTASDELVLYRIEKERD